jgi:xylulokinase
VLFLPYLSGERTPHADPYARAAFTGLGLEHRPAALTRAVLEGVAYGLRDSLELLRQLGVRAESGRVSGGGARSRLWLKIVASTLGIPLELTGRRGRRRLRRGLARRGRCRCVLGRPRGGRGMRPASERFEPDEGWMRAYEAGYPRYRALYPSLEHLEER